MMVLLIFSILTVGILIWSAVDSCRIELRYNNKLKKEGNELLEELLKDKKK